ncbi:MAG TPA: DEAD/DEAH box helicase, partial [Trebonia sp.]
MPAESSAAPEDDLTAPDITFAALGVPAELVEVLDGQGIAAPFPVQAATLPDALAGRDILGRARTGSGKTLGFSLPMVSRLAGGSTLPGRPRGLVLVPTRELATQVSTVLKPLARVMGLWVTTIYGGVSYGPQVNALQRRTDIVVATPGRLADLIGQRECDLSDVKVTVIDEADQMADLGFLPIVRRLLETTPEDGQRMLFSATLDAAIDVLARQFLHDPVLHSVDEDASPAEIEHHVLTVEAGNRVAVIAALAGGEQRSLVFTRTKHGAERLARQLTEAGIPAAELHGNLRQGARSRNLAAFADGIARVMVATDIAARGIHIDGIDLVIHADPPAEHKAYVHRSGRTARGGADGVVVTLQTKAQVRDVTAMMSKAGITPHEAVVVDAESEVLTEIGGPPVPRVKVSGKISELVHAEDRLARNDHQGGGSAGRPRDRYGDRGRSRDRKPREDSFRDRRPRNDGFRPAVADRPDRADRPERSAPVDRDRPRRFDDADRPSRPDRGDQGNRNDRFERGDRAPRFDRDSGPARDQRFGGNDRPARDDRGDRFDRRPDNRGSDSRGGDNRGTDNRGTDNRGFGDRSYGDRPDRRDSRGTENRGFGNRGHGDRPDRRNSQGNRNSQGSQGGRGDRNSNDWWPRPAAGSSWRPYTPGNQANGNRSARDDRNRDDRNRNDGGRDNGYRGDRPYGGNRDSGPSRGGRPYGGNRDSGPSRDDRPYGRDRDSRPSRDDRPFREGRPVQDERPGNRPFRDDRPVRDERYGRDERPYRAARPQASGRPQSGGQFGGPSRPSGYSAGRGAAG